MEWKKIINEEIDKEYMKVIYSTIESRRQIATVYPDAKDVFRAFQLTPFNSTKVIILGQDPYHDGNADGLAFSCKKKMSPSLSKIYGNLKTDMFNENTPLTLETWAKQGVLLLNTILTVEKGWAKAHEQIGWQQFTSVIIKSLLTDPYPKVFLLWGAVAKNAYTETALQVYEDVEHLPHIKTIRCEHPAKAAYDNREWNNNDCFNKANKFLIQNKLKPIEWLSLPVEESKLQLV